MIQLKMRGDKWRLSIIDEEWEFDNLEIMKSYLNNLLEAKRLFGNINKKENKKDELFKCRWCGEIHE